MSIANNTHISIGFGITLGRLYYTEGEFFCFLMDNESIKPFATNKVHMMSEYLTETLSKTNAEISWQVSYPSTTPRKKKKKIKDLVLAKSQNITNGY